MDSFCVLAFVGFLFVVSTTSAEKILLSHKDIYASTACRIEEVRINPCVITKENDYCNVKALSSININVVYTLHVGCETPTNKLKLVKQGTFMKKKIDTVDPSAACRYTSCPLKSEEKATYDATIPITSDMFKKGRTWGIEWKLQCPGQEPCVYESALDLLG